ncbi:unnamed protein product [Prorocentrum cordatum]|uniref:Uncharacterized protein n=1 Tax=Prorocentrum cordatum TaxID=2364126 RepID=A0ABN9R8N1_9DINO|nr:unnamed protein product [Polarella glacialis]
MSEHYPSPRPARLLARRGPQQQAPPWDRNPENFLPCKAALLEALKRAEEEAAAARTDAASARRLAETARQELAESYRENAACNFELVRDLLQARREAQAEADDAAEARAALQDAEARQEATVARLREEHHAARAEDALEATEATGIRANYHLEVGHKTALMTQINTLSDQLEASREKAASYKDELTETKAELAAQRQRTGAQQPAERSRRCWGGSGRW